MSGQTKPIPAPQAHAQRRQVLNLLAGKKPKRWARTPLVPAPASAQTKKQIAAARRLLRGNRVRSRRRRYRRWRRMRPGTIFAPDLLHVQTIVERADVQAILRATAWTGQRLLSQAFSVHGADCVTIVLSDDRRGGIIDAPREKKVRTVPATCVGDVVVAAALLYAEIAHEQPPGRRHMLYQPGKRGAWMAPPFGALYLSELRARWTPGGLRVVVVARAG